MKWLQRVLGVTPPEKEEGMTWEGSYWEVSPPKDLPAFLRGLADLVPEGSVLYLEVGSTSRALRSYLEERKAAEPAPVAVTTVWPRPERFHMTITRENLEGLAKLAERHRVSRRHIANHLHVYRDGKLLLQSYDFGSDDFAISKDIPEERVKTFCAKLGLSCQDSEAMA
jgi:hypothetical protein